MLYLVKARLSSVQGRAHLEGVLPKWKGMRETISVGLKHSSIRA
jgi:hypothetical protein